jgi:uncharacterized protein YjbI with pentapeptide repeats
MDAKDDSMSADDLSSNERKRFWLRVKWPSLGIGIVLAFGAAYWLITTPSLPGWTNFNDKGLWDVLELIIVPVALAIGGYFLSTRQKATELEIARRERESEQHIAQDREQEQSLQTYFDRMSELLLNHQLRESENDSEQRSIARSRTLTTLRRLNPERKGALLLFLYEAGLIKKDVVVVPLVEANLTYANLTSANLINANLERANLAHANLVYVYLINANLKRANLAHANLEHANLTGANLMVANLTGTYLAGAYLAGADLRRATLVGANLVGVHYDESTVWPADFSPLENEAI